MTTHQPTMQPQAFRNGSRHCHQPLRHKSPTSSRFYEMNISQKNNSKKQLPATASRWLGSSSFLHVHYSNWSPRVRHWQPDSYNKPLHQPTHHTLQSLTTLHTALSHFVHFTPYIDKSHAIFSVSLIHLTCLFAFPSQTHHSIQWRSRFKQLQVTPHTYHYQMFTHPNAVYAKLFFNQHHTRHQYHQHGHTYIGSTSITIPKREYNRHAKLKQLHNNHPISAELSLRYWHSKNNLHHYSTIYLSHHDTYDQAWTYEHLRIQEWQPTLNWPYIQRHLKLKASGWQFSKHRTNFTRMSTHKRLFQRLRRRQHTIKQPHLHTSQRLHALTVLRELSKHTLSSFSNINSHPQRQIH